MITVTANITGSRYSTKKPITTTIAIATTIATVITMIFYYNDSGSGSGSYVLLLVVLLRLRLARCCWCWWLFVCLYRSRGGPDNATGTRSASASPVARMATRILCAYQGSATSRVKGA